jgi:hypothetical protein
MTSDNASNNDTAMKEVAHEIDPEGVHWIPATRRIRCQEHILNLATRHFIDMVAPTPQAKLMKKIRHALNMGNDDDLNILNKELTAMEVNGDHEKDDVFDTGDSLGKALALIDQVCAALLFYALADWCC